VSTKLCSLVFIPLSLCFVNMSAGGEGSVTVQVHPSVNKLFVEDQGNLNNNIKKNINLAAKFGTGVPIYPVIYLTAIGHRPT